MVPEFVPQQYYFQRRLGAHAPTNVHLGYRKQVPSDFDCGQRPAPDVVFMLLFYKKPYQE